jgi:general secretion pathway protein G
MMREVSKMHNEKCEIKKIKVTPLYSLLQRRGAGFTLLEIIVVVFILSLLAAIVAPKIIGRTDDARIAEAKVQIRNFETALKLFKMDNGFYPDTQQGLQVLVEKPTSGRIPQNYKEGGYLEQNKIPFDPWGNPYIYVSPGLNGDYDLMSYGADGKEGGEGKDADIKSWDMK